MDGILVVTNSRAGSGGAAAVDAAVGVLREAAAVEVVATENADQLERVLAARAGRPVVVVGGDGSVHAVVAVLHARDWLDDTVVGLIPAGTGNDFAREIELPLDPAAAARAFLGGRRQAYDLLVDDDGGVVANHVHIGVGVDAADEAHAFKRRFGRLGYVLGALRAGFVHPGARLRVEVDGEVLAAGDREVLQVSIGNGTYVGGGVPLAPDARLDDGLADVLVSFAVSTPRRMVYAARARFGQHPRAKDVHTRRGTRVLVEGPAFRWNVDGELVGPASRREWRVSSRKLTLQVP